MSKSTGLDLNSVIVALANREQYKEELKEIPHDSFLDLSIVYRMPVKKTGENEQFALVTNAMPEESGTDMETLRKYGYANLIKLYGISCKCLKNGKHLLTNENKIFGTALMLHSFVLEDLADRQNDDLYIVPKSVHECLVVAKRKADVDKLMEELGKCNQETMKKEDILSDNIYFYDFKTKELETRKKENVDKKVQTGLY